MRILVTGGAGFIGSHFVRLLLRDREMRVVNLDALRYAGNLENLRDVERDPLYSFIHGDICDARVVGRAISEFQVEAIVNFAAETHVDRSIIEPESFIRTDVVGTGVLLEAARTTGIRRFVQVSTDEVYGEVASGSSVETDRLLPRSPYAASKAAAELLAFSYFLTHGLPVLVTRGSNTYGPNQYPEKFIPLFVTNAIEDLPLPLYGDGLQRRDWIYVEDHCEAIALVLRDGVPGDAYNIGGGQDHANKHIAEKILAILGKPGSLIRHVSDRAGHDRRYALNCEKLKRLGWQPTRQLDDALKATVLWYRDNHHWWRPLKSGDFQAYYERVYGARLTQ